MAEEHEQQTYTSMGDSDSSNDSSTMERPSSTSESATASPARPVTRAVGRPPKAKRGRGGGRGISIPTPTEPRMPRGGRRGRSRGPRGRGRGSRAYSMSSEEEQRIRALKEARHAKLETMCDQVERNVLKEIVIKMADRNPSLGMDIEKILKENLPQQEPQPQPEPPVDAPDWCICNRCREMPTALERVCCRLPPGECRSMDPVMELSVTDEFHLGVLRVTRGDILGFHNEDREEGEEDNASMRHAAYRSFIFWRYNALTAGDRRVIPSCCVWYIRDKYPSPTGQYTGFNPRRII